MDKTIRILSLKKHGKLDRKSWVPLLDPMVVDEGNWLSGMSWKAMLLRSPTIDHSRCQRKIGGLQEER